MADKLFNEAEQYLLGRWSDAYLLATQLDRVRGKYKELCQKTVDATLETHKDLNIAEVYATQFWGPGSIGVGKKGWPLKKNGAISGFWIGNIRLEVLLDEEGALPNASVWVEKRAWSEDFDKLKSDIRVGTSSILTKDEKARWKYDDPEEDGTILWYEFPESKKELLAMLLNGSGNQFVECIAAHFESLARFTQVLDEVLVKKAGSVK